MILPFSAKISLCFLINFFLCVGNFHAQVFKPFSELNVTSRKELNLSIEINSNLKDDLGSFFNLTSRFYYDLGLNIYAGGTDKSFQSGMSFIKYFPLKSFEKNKHDIFLLGGINKITYKSQGFNLSEDKYRLKGSQYYVQTGYQRIRKNFSMLCYLKTTYLDFKTMEIFGTTAGTFANERNYISKDPFLIHQIGLKIGLKTKIFSPYICYDALLNGNENQINHNAVSIAISSNLIALRRFVK
jgi:hypothetical protein